MSSNPCIYMNYGYGDHNKQQTKATSGCMAAQVTGQSPCVRSQPAAAYRLNGGPVCKLTLPSPLIFLQFFIDDDEQVQRRTTYNAVVFG